MAIPTGTLSNFAAIGENEDLEQDIYDISPTETPFMTAIGRGKASNTLHEWQTDALAAASSTNKAIDGDDATTSTATPTVRYGNYCQILQKTPRVTGTLRATSTAGRADEYSYQVAKRAKELKRDLESSLLSGNGGDAGSALTARAMAGAGAWLWDNAVDLAGATSSTVVVSSGVPSAVVIQGTPVAVTEANLTSVLESIWDDGGDPTAIYCDGTNKKAISGFTGIATLYRDTGQSKAQASILGAADLYISDFGEVRVYADRFADTNTIYVMDLDFWEVAYLRPMQTNPLAKTGDSDRAQLLCEATLVAKNPSSSGKIYTTT